MILINFILTLKNYITVFTLLSLSYRLKNNYSKTLPISIILLCSKRIYASKLLPKISTSMDIDIVNYPNNNIDLSKNFNCDNNQNPMPLDLCYYGKKNNVFTSLENSKKRKKVSLPEQKVLKKKKICLSKKQLDLNIPLLEKKYNINYNNLDLIRNFEIPESEILQILDFSVLRKPKNINKAEGTFFEKDANNVILSLKDFAPKKSISAPKKKIQILNNDNFYKINKLEFTQNCGKLLKTNVDDQIIANCLTKNECLIGPEIFSIHQDKNKTIQAKTKIKDINFFFLISKYKILKSGYEYYLYRSSYLKWKLEMQKLGKNGGSKKEFSKYFDQLLKEHIENYIDVTDIITIKK